MNRQEAIEELHAEFGVRAERLGLRVMPVSDIRDTPVSGHLEVWTLNNAMRQEEEGTVEYVSLSRLNECVL